MINANNQWDTKVIMMLDGQLTKFIQAKHNVFSLDWDGGGGAEKSKEEEHFSSSLHWSSYLQGIQYVRVFLLFDLLLCDLFFQILIMKIFTVGSCLQIDKNPKITPHSKDCFTWSIYRIQEGHQVVKGWSWTSSLTSVVLLVWCNWW